MRSPGRGTSPAPSLERSRPSYVVAIPHSQSVGLGIRGNPCADTLAVQAPPHAGVRARSADQSAKGPRKHDRALSHPTLGGRTWFRPLAAGRSNASSRSRGELELTFYTCHSPAGTTSGELTGIAVRLRRSRNSSRRPKASLGQSQHRALHQARTYQRQRTKHRKTRL